MWFGLWQKGLKKGFCSNNSEVPVSTGAGYVTKRDRCLLPKANHMRKTKKV